MRRFWFLLSLLVVLIGGGLFLAYERMPFIISNYLAIKIDAPVSLQTFSANSTTLEFDHFEMKNPEGFKLPDALVVDHVFVKAPLYNYLGNPVIIDEIELDGVYIGMELSKSNTQACNWNELTKRMSADSNNWYSVKRTALIKKLILKNITVDLVKYGKSTDKIGPIEQAVFENIDVQEGIPSKEIAKVISRYIMKSIFSFSGFIRLFELPMDAASAIFDPPANSSEECPKFMPGASQPPANKPT